MYNGEHQEYTVYTHIVYIAYADGPGFAQENVSVNADYVRQ